MGIADWFRRRYGSPAPDDLLQQLIDGFRREDYPRLMVIIDEHSAAIREQFPSWTTVPAEIRNDSADLQQYVNTLLAIDPGSLSGHPRAGAVRVLEMGIGERRAIALYRQSTLAGKPASACLLAIRASRRGAVVAHLADTEAVSSDSFASASSWSAGIGIRVPSRRGYRPSFWRQQTSLDHRRSSSSCRGRQGQCPSLQSGRPASQSHRSQPLRRSEDRRDSVVQTVWIRLCLADRQVTHDASVGAGAGLPVTFGSTGRDSNQAVDRSRRCQKPQRPFHRSAPVCYPRRSRKDQRLSVFFRGHSRPDQ